jgi:hypothetical protein
MEITRNPEKLPAAKKYVYDRLADGRFHPKVARIFPFAQAGGLQISRIECAGEESCDYCSLIHADAKLERPRLASFTVTVTGQQKDIRPSERRRQSKVNDRSAACTAYEILAITIRRTGEQQLEGGGSPEMAAVRPVVRGKWVRAS